MRKQAMLTLKHQSKTWHVSLTWQVNLKRYQQLTKISLRMHLKKRRLR